MPFCAGPKKTGAAQAEGRLWSLLLPILRRLLLEKASTSFEKAGESPADCYNRACGFLESFCQSLQGDATALGRQFAPRLDLPQENQVIVSHGTMLVALCPYSKLALCGAQVLLMRIFQIPIHEFAAWQQWILRLTRLG